MDIEDATAADVDVLVDLWVGLATEQQVHGAHLLPDGNRSRIREAMLQRVVADALLLARPAPDVDPVGFVMFTEVTGGFATDTARGLVENLYVEPSARGEGLGQELLASAEQRLAHRGVETVHLEVMAENEPAREFYADAGYTPHRLELEKPVESDTHTKGDQ
jgi:ribosomal protein S18 acetylase RimI-like enzyme